MKLTGAPKLVVWAEKVRTDRLKAWAETSPEVFRAIEPLVMMETRADWWLAYKDKGLETVCNDLLGGKSRSSNPEGKKGQGKKR